MRRKINFGKIDYLGIGRKTCQVEVELELKDTAKGPEFTASATVWNHVHTDSYMGGQCLDELTRYFKHNKAYLEILRLWHLYHLNGMHAGTPSQEAALKKYHEDNNIAGWNYTDDCEYLKSIDLYVDNGYTYGHGWLYEAIPEEDLNKIKDLLKLN